MRRTWERESCIVPPLRHLTSICLAKRFQDGRHLAREHIRIQDSKPPPGWDPFPCVWGNISELWENGAVVRVASQRQRKEKVPCEDRMVSPSEERPQRDLRQRNQRPSSLNVLKAALRGGGGVSPSIMIQRPAEMTPLVFYYRLTSM